MAVGNVVALTTSPQQLNVPSGGVTIINLTNTPVQLSPDITMLPSVTYTLGANATLPYPIGPLYAQVASGTGSILVLNGTYNISNPNVTITSGTVDANITNADINVTPATGAVFDINGAVDATITNADITITPKSGVSFPVTGSVDANITNASITVGGAVDASITNASIDVSPTSGATFPISGAVNASITNASLTISGAVNANITNANIPVFPGTTQNFPISGTVDANITNAILSIGGFVNANITNANIDVSPASGATFPISGTVNASITNATLDITGSTVNIQNVAGGVISVGDEIDFLGTFAATAGAAQFTTSKSYSAIMVIAQGINPSPDDCYAVYVVDTNLGTYAPVFCSPFGPVIQYDENVLQAICGMGNKAGDTITVRILPSVSTSLTAGTIYVYGMTSCPTKLRTDGRGYPLGSKAVEWKGQGSGALIPSPGPAYCIMLKSLIVSYILGNGSHISIDVTIGGVTVNIGGGTELTAQTFMTWENGLVCDPGTEVSYFITSGPSANYLRVTATYDIVI